jgi:uncharacterized membrane protein
MPRKQLHLLLLAAASLWCLLIVLAPLWDSALIYRFFSMICHQDPTRSWHIGGRALPTCIRCTSIYFGFLLSIIVWLRANRSWLKLAISATVIEFVLARIFLDSTFLRSATGIALGATVAPFVRLGTQELVRSALLHFRLGASRGSM